MAGMGSTQKIVAAVAVVIASIVAGAVGFAAINSGSSPADRLYESKIACFEGGGEWKAPGEIYSGNGETVGPDGDCLNS